MGVTLTLMHIHSITLCIFQKKEQTNNWYSKKIKHNKNTKKYINQGGKN